MYSLGCSSALRLRVNGGRCAPSWPLPAAFCTAGGSSLVGTMFTAGRLGKKFRNWGIIEDGGFGAYYLGYKINIRYICDLDVSDPMNFRLIQYRVVRSDGGKIGINKILNTE